MMESYLKKIILDFCSFFNKTVEVIAFENERIPECKVQGSLNIVKGFRNIVAAVSDCKNVQTPEYLCTQDQWIEYASTKGVFLQNSSQAPYILKELNECISDKVYFGGNRQSPADVLLYLFAYDVMVNLTFLEKENYMHMSRWFNNMHQDEKLRR